MREHGVRDGLADGMAKARQYLAHRNLESGSRDGSLSDDTSHQIWNLESGSRDGSLPADKGELSYPCSESAVMIGGPRMILV